jgi:hypothetical protein
MPQPVGENRVDASMVSGIRHSRRTIRLSSIHSGQSLKDACQSETLQSTNYYQNIPRLRYTSHCLPCYQHYVEVRLLQSLRSFRSFKTVDEERHHVHRKQLLLQVLRKIFAIQYQSQPVCFSDTRMDASQTLPYKLIFLRGENHAGDIRTSSGQHLPGC